MQEAERRKIASTVLGGLSYGLFDPGKPDVDLMNILAKFGDIVSKGLHAVRHHLKEKPGDDHYRNGYSGG